MTVTPSRLKGIDHTNGNEKMVKLGGSLGFSGNTLIDGVTEIVNGEAAPITKGQVVYKTATADEYELANATDSSTAPLQGKYGVVFDASIPAAGAGVAVESGRIDGVLVGATPGQAYYLDTTNGAIVTAPPTADDNILLYVGYAINATDLFVNFGQPIEQ